MDSSESAPNTFDMLVSADKADWARYFLRQGKWEINPPGKLYAFPVESAAGPPSQRINENPQTDIGPNADERPQPEADSPISTDSEAIPIAAFAGPEPGPGLTPRQQQKYSFAIAILYVVLGITVVLIIIGYAVMS